MKTESRKEPGLVRVTRNGKRFFSEEFKRAVIAKCLAPDASVSAVALAHGFNTNLVRKWIARHQAREGGPQPATQLVPVTVIDADAEPTTRSEEESRPEIVELPAGSIEIEIGAVRVKVLGRVDPGQLRLVLETLGVAR